MQTLPDYVYERPEQLTRQTTNPRYKFFRQNHYTAGDYEQFLEGWDASFSSLTTLESKEPVALMPSSISWRKYKGACVHDVFNTYMYLSEKFKKGIFIRTATGKAPMKTFLPFSNAGFTNEWSSSIQMDRKRFASVQDLTRYIAHQEGKPFDERRVHKDTKSWYGNNGLVRLEFPTSEGDSGCNMLRDMFRCLSEERDLPDASFFLNKRDFPVLTRDGTESYTSFFGTGTPLVSHHYERYAPILGMTTTDHHADIPVPTWDDWCRVSYWHDKRLFAKEFRTYPTPEELDAISWDSKKPVLVFRGASTGLGTRISNNPRLFFSAESAKGKKDTDGLFFLDVGITKWNLRPRKHPDSRFLETIHVKEMPFSLVPPLSPLEQAAYKYILHLPGHSCAYRLSLELYSGSVVFLYPCAYKLWYSDWLQPWVHYVPLDPKDPNDVYKKVRWCKDNDAECHKIATNAREFAHRFLGRDAILDYLWDVLWSLHTRNGGVEYARSSLDTLLDNKARESIQETHNRLDRMAEDPLVSYLLSFSDRATNPTTMRLCLRHLLKKDPCFLDKIPMETIVETRNTQVKRFRVQGEWVVWKKTRKGWKNNQMLSLHLAGTGMNDLADVMPHFMHTYDTTETETHTISLLEYIEGRTLEAHLREKKPCLEEIIRIWLQTCLALHAAQQKMGFLHMDLYPWNIILWESPHPVTVDYPLEWGKTARATVSTLPVLVDYEKSHFVSQGVHFYSTTPFRFCRLQDVLSMVFSTLFIYLETTTPTEAEVFQILGIMNFFSSEYTQNHRFYTLSRVKIFLKKHKKFSRMMYEPKTGLETRSPLDFFHHLATGARFPFETVGRLYQEVLEPPCMVRQVQMELDLIDRTYIDSPRATVEEKRVTLRRYWLSTEKKLVAGSATDQTRLWYNMLVRKECLQRMQDSFEGYEKRLGCKIWEHVAWEDLFGYPVYVPTDEAYGVFRKWVGSLTCCPNTVPASLPLMPSHLCRACLEPAPKKTAAVSMDHAHRLFYIASRLFLGRLSTLDLDLFSLWTQEFYHEFSDFLH
jgi:hypothetical protein